MKCIKCGNIIKNKICNECGEQNHYIKYKDIRNSNRKETGIILIIISIFIFLLAIGYRNLKDYSVKEYIEINNQKIPTITSLLGRKNVVNYTKEKGIETIIYDYSNFTNEDVENYLSLLIENEFSMYETTNGVGLLKEVDENNNLLIVYLNVLNGNLKVEYRSIIDSIENYTLDGDIKIGNNEIGFIKVPAQFSKKEIKEEYIKYINTKNKKESITLEVNKDKKTLTDYSNYYMKLYQNNKAATIKNVITIYGYKGVQIDANFTNEGIYLRSYIYTKEDSSIYHITLESDSLESEVFSSIYSYEVVN